MKNPLISKELRHHFRKYEMSLNQLYLDKQNTTLNSSPEDKLLTKYLVHDLVSPLSSARAVFMLLDEKPKYGKDRKVLEAAKASIESAVSILDSVKELQSVESEKREFDVAESITKVCTIVHNEVLRGDISLQIECANHIFYIGYQNIFERILLNLIINAIEELKPLKSNLKLIEVRALMSKQGLKVSVKDSGRGISKYKLKHLLKRGILPKTLILDLV